LTLRKSIVTIIFIIIVFLKFTAKIQHYSRYYIIDIPEYNREMFMASEKKPSIYYDRGTIGSSNELDEYGVWVKSEPQDLSSVGGENREPALDEGNLDVTDMADLPDFDINSETGASDDAEENFEDDLTFDSVTNSMAEEDLELPDIEIPSEDELDTAGEDFSGEGSLEAEEEAEEGFDEISMDELIEDREEAPMRPLSSGTAIVQEPVEDAPAAPETRGMDLSTQLLMKIANELSSIKNELSTLKQELAGFKAGEKAAAGDEEDQNRGFFGEEEDEKIALTGDELNNILNTADFTEEAGADATEELQDDFSSLEAEDDSSSGPFQDLAEPEPAGETEEKPGFLSDQDDIIEEDLEIPGGEELVFEEAAEETINESPFAETPAPGESAPEMELELKEESLEDFSEDLDITFDESGEELPDFSVEDSGLGLVLEEGAVPITPAPAPEEADFLEEDPLAGSGAEPAASPEPEAFSELEAPPEPEFSLEETDISFEEDLSMDEPAPFPEEVSAGEPDLSLEEGLSTEDGDLSLEEDLFQDEPDLSPEPGDTLDLTGAVIDEPDLSEEIKENPLQEPSLEDISIDLDLEEDFPEIGEDENSGAAAFADETPEEGDIEISADSFEEVPEASEDLTLIPEGFVVESEDAEASIEAGSGEGDDLDLVEKEFEEPGEEEEPSIEAPEPESTAIPSHLKQELKTVLSYMDHLLESLPDDKIEEFARSEHFNTYKKLFKELGLV
jgi:hypothetical protein